MAKRIQSLADWVTAHDSAQVLSLKHERPISPKYIRSLAKRKKEPVRTQTISNRLLYNKNDIEATTIRRKA